MGWIIKRFLKRKIDEIAKKTRASLLEIPFYRKKIREYNIPLDEVKSLSSIKKLEKFLNKYNIKWITPGELINKDFSLFLSRVPQRERVWVQTSSGYSIAWKKDKVKIGIKRVAYTWEDVNEVMKQIYFYGIKSLLKDYNLPTITIFSRLNGLALSGRSPFIGLTLLSAKFPLRVFPFGEPLTEEQYEIYTKLAVELDSNGIISTPYIFSRIEKCCEKLGMSFPHLKFVALGGYTPTQDIVKKCHEIGSKIVVDGYSLQEVMPLGAIASGVISSEDTQIGEDEGLIPYGTLCYLRIVDEDNQSVGEGEKGEIKITSPFKGTSLVDYPTGDVSKVISLYSVKNFKGRTINLPLPTLSYEINRKNESLVKKINEYPIHLDMLSLLLRENVGYENFLIYTASDELVVMTTKEKSDRVKEIIRRAFFSAQPSVYEKIRIIEVERESLEKFVYPDGYKPHNIYPEKLQELEELLY